MYKLKLWEIPISKTYKLDSEKFVLFQKHIFEYDHI